MSERVNVTVDYGDGKSDVLRIGPLGLLLHASRLGLISQKHTKHAKKTRHSHTKMSTFKHLKHDMVIKSKHINGSCN